MVDTVTNHILNASGILLRHVGHEILTIGHRTNVGIENLDFLIRILEQQLWLGLQGIECLIGIAVIELSAGIGILADGEVDHKFVDRRIPDGLRCPGTTDIAETLREELVDTNLVVRPVYQIVGSHEHQTAVVAPAILVGAFPAGSTIALLLGIDVEVGHSDIELAVGGAIDMRVADTSLLGNAVASDDGLALVHRCEVITVIADGHKQ